MSDDRGYFAYDNAELFYQEYENAVYIDQPLDDAPFWTKIAQEKPQRVLELTCGYGRLTSLFDGYSERIVGLDASRSMIEFGRDIFLNQQFSNKKNLKIELRHGDARSFNLGETFDLIFFGFNGFLHLLTYEDVSHCLQCVRSHLSPQGRFIIANTNPSRRLMGILLHPDVPDRYQVASLFPYPKSSDVVNGMRRRRYDHANQLLTIDNKYVFMHSGDEYNVELVFRIYYGSELPFLLNAFGFSVDTVWGDYEFGAFTSDSPEMIVSSRLRS